MSEGDGAARLDSERGAMMHRMKKEKKWTRAWAVKRLLSRMRSLLAMQHKDTKEWCIAEGRVRELIDMLEER